MAKELSFQNYIQIGDEEPVLMDTLSKEERELAGFLLNAQGLKALGYVPEDQKKYNAELERLRRNVKDKQK